MAAPSEYLLQRLRLWGCGLVDREGLEPSELRALHHFKTKVSDLGAELYKEMPAAKADAYIVKAVFSIIQAQLKSLEP
jgi:hypothetical protein